MSHWSRYHRWARRTGTLAMGIGAVLWTGAVVDGQRESDRASTAAPASPPPASSTAAAQRALIDRYCVTCHNERLKARNGTPIALDSLDVASVPAHAEEWEKVIAKLRAGLMPPAGMPRPDKTTLDGLSSWLETEIDRASAANPNPGRTDGLHRLNRAEYQNAVRDLLNVDVDVTDLLPADDVSSGFDNVASTLTMSPTLMDRYLSVAQKISRMAIGIPAPAANVQFFRVADDLAQDKQLPGLPFGTRGGTRIRYTFPIDGEYAIKVRLARDLNEQMPVYPDAQQLEVSVDGRRVQVFTLPGAARPAGRGQGGGRGAAPAADSQVGRGGADPAPATPAGEPAAQTRRPGPSAGQAPEGQRLQGNAREERNRADQNWDVRVTVTAGAHDVVATFLNQTVALDESPRLPFLRPFPAGNNVPETRLGSSLRSVEISGPYGTGATGDSASRRRIFVCHTGASQGGAARRSSVGNATSEDECSNTILRTLARRAYRRPVTDADVQPLLALYREGREQGGFEAGIERALRRLLVSPEFLYRVEVDPPNARAGRAYPVSDMELASRLSFFLWSSIPDDELLDAAERGELRKPAVLTKHVTRMLQDPRSEALIDNFAGQWLFLRNVPGTGPAASLFPDFDDGLRQAFRRETELFFESLVREDRSAIDLLRGDYTFLNERLALHYGIRTVKGPQFRRYAWPQDDIRRGILGQGSILTLTSYPDRTSPVVRGKWVLENILGTPPPPPLPDVGDLKTTNGSGVVLTMRERLAMHRASPQCASCHSMLDPLGLALENFDGVGKWRTRDESGQPIDSAAVLPDGTRIDGPVALRTALLARSDRFLMTFTGKLLTYALGRRLEHYDTPVIRQILRDAAPGDYRVSTGIVLGIVRSTPFQMRRPSS